MHCIDSWKSGFGDVFGAARAVYGEKIVPTLSRQLTQEYGAGFSRQNLFHMIRFAETWPDQAKVAALASHLGRSHFKESSTSKPPTQTYLTENS